MNTQGVALQPLLNAATNQSEESETSGLRFSILPTLVRPLPHKMNWSIGPSVPNSRRSNVFPRNTCIPKVRVWLSFDFAI